MTNPNHPISFTDADQAATVKLMPTLNDGFVQTILFQHFPTGLPSNFGSWAELVTKVLSS